MPLILGTNSIKDTGYDVANSVRFNDNDSAYMHKTPGSAGDQQKFTFSFWIKRSNIETGTTMTLFDTQADGDNQFKIRLNDNSTLTVESKVSDHNDSLITNQLFRDVSAWYSIIIAVDTTQGTAGNRVKLYVNGTRVTSFATENYPAENLNTLVNAANKLYVGTSVGTDSFYDGYLAEFCLVDGSQLAETSFGEFDSDSGIWKPIDVSGLTFGTNGFYLDFEASDNLGNDANGGTDLTEVNLAATDQSIDTCTNNFATFNPLYRNSNSAINYAEGNLSAIPAADGSISFSGSTIAMPKTSTSKWYAEFKTPVAEYGSLGIMDVDSISQAINDNTDISSNSNGTSLGRVLFQQGNGVVYYIGGTASTGLSSEANNDIISIAWDAGAGKFYVAQNGTYGTISGTQQDPANGTAGVDVSGEAWYTASSAFVWYVGDNTTGASSQFFGNFGSPHFAISSGNTDGNGYGNFEYAVPSGFYALCTKNLAEFGG